MRTINVVTRLIAPGKWAACYGAHRYHPGTVRDTEQAARVARLEEIGREAQDTIDEVDRQLDKLGALDARDPHGYLA